MLSVLVPGGTGQLGHDLAALASADVEVTAPGSAELDLTDVGSVLKAVGALAERARETGRRPLVINAAAYTAVDAAETDERRAFAVNVDGPRVLAAACSSRGVPLVHVSTDYVFPGDADRPYEPEDEVGPRSAYGRTKAAGEDAVLGSGARAWVVRTAWVYGASGSNFVKTMVRLEGERETLSVVDDQRGAPTWSADLAAGLLELGEAIAAGRGPERRVLHCTGGGETTWYGFTRAIFEELGADPERVKPCTTEEFPRPAPRPAYSVLSNKSWVDAGLTPLRPWREALSAYFAAARR
ncbi:dTDP-4-dehydrorhamnose reductase [Amycolatopsis bartoniae]|uniref:dTDP-4-dehydrorhamnose reductase n=1 Tax=Amycolatopsis bartoniae TaxID=941986 RepID=A0A8H9J1D1_9PSEU|nr:dTDP-4-dehydrorhamnose reductase [Amycolatopsis bartoniae]MBB2937302.1 dTDP-4-dehydrorhamnose reductase [Amycolatopsis bartoniae]TVT07942.1 dTDP-4-dehydrorhamnose reductase [Amycolatopsis bartoniae]GHF77994.1 NAD(P)-dependent oxidoreductase [Amycolatopsis bartoniae]